MLAMVAVGDAKEYTHVRAEDSLEQLAERGYGTGLGEENALLLSESEVFEGPGRGDDARVLARMEQLQVRVLARAEEVGDRRQDIFTEDILTEAVENRAFLWEFLPLSCCDGFHLSLKKHRAVS